MVIMRVVKYTDGFQLGSQKKSGLCNYTVGLCVPTASEPVN